MPASRILLIAPDRDFRKSLAFTLEAEGFVVTSHAGIPGTGAAAGYDCVVLDQAATRGRRPATLDFLHGAPRLVLLAPVPEPWLERLAWRFCALPLSGGDFADAVRAATFRPQTHPK